MSEEHANNKYRFILCDSCGYLVSAKASQDWDCSHTEAEEITKRRLISAWSQSID